MTIPYSEFWPKPERGMKEYKGELCDKIHIKGADLGSYGVLEQIGESAAKLLLREIATTGIYSRLPRARRAVSRIHSGK